jgi:hypothetical protein
MAAWLHGCMAAWLHGIVAIAANAGTTQQTLAYPTKKKFYNFDTSSRFELWGQFYVTFYSCNLRVFVIG